MKIEKVQPQTVDGIEFYISNDGTQAGVSQVGLAILTGVSETKVRRDFKARAENGLFDYYSEHNPDCISGRAIVITSNQNAKVVSARSCADYIKKEAEKGNSVASYSLDKFLDLGFTTWVKEVVGFGRAGDLTNLEASMNKLLGMVGVLSAKFDKMEDETAAYRSVVVKREGLKDWMQLERDIASSPSLPPSCELYTLGEYLKIVKNMVFDKSQMAMFSTKVAFVYRAMQKEIPHRKQARRPNGQLAPEVNAYSQLDFPMLDLAYKQTVIEF